MSVAIKTDHMTVNGDLTVSGTIRTDEATAAPPMVRKAAGVMIRAASGRVLFLHRAKDAPDSAGCWAFPGGGREADETPMETAAREADEEIGDIPDKIGPMILHTRTTSSPPLVGVAGTGESTVRPVQEDSPASPDEPQLIVIPPPVDFTTFLQNVIDEFAPTLNDEHDGYVWADPLTGPVPLHPGCAIALARLTMNEVDVARAIADGRLTSPQVYENMHLWAIRITGTNVAFRPKEDEYVLRKPEHYLTPDFLARCNGLPVILKHPKTALLNSEEFANRIVGTIFLPYVAGDEVWGIAKIFNDEANKTIGEMSTSPGVNFKDFSVNAKLVLQDGSKVLIEGSPSLLDHIAICDLGVWDKGGEPTGIRSEAREDSVMADKDKDDTKAKDDAKVDAKTDAKVDGADDKSKADADAGTSIKNHVMDAMKPFTDAMSSMMDSITGIAKRVDAFEKKEPAKADADDKDKDDKSKADAKKDADDDTKDEPKKTAADSKKDADDDKDDKKAKTDDVGDLRAQLEQVRGMIPKSLGDADYHTVTDAQSRADEVFAMFGLHAPRPLAGETAGSYERRMVKTLKTHSPTWKGVDVASQAFADEAVFAPIRDQVYSEARAAAVSPANVPEGQLRQVVKRQGGHTVTEFHGAPSVWMNPLAGAVKLKATGAFLTGNMNGGRH